MITSKTRLGFDHECDLIIDRGHNHNETFVQIRSAGSDNWDCGIFYNEYGLSLDIGGVRVQLDYGQASNLYYCLRDLANRGGLCVANPDEWDLREVAK